MTPTALYQLLSSCWHSDGSFALASSTLPAGAAQSLIANVFANQTLTLSGATAPTRNGDTVSIATAPLDGELLSMSGCTLSAVFGIDVSGAVTTRLVVTPPATKAVSLASMFSTVSAERELYALAFSGLTLVFDSTCASGTYSEIQAARIGSFYNADLDTTISYRFQMSGTPTLGSATNWLTGWLPALADTLTTGLVEVLAGVPRFVLKTQVGPPLTLGHLSATFFAQLISLYALESNDATTPYSVDSIELDGVIAYENTPGLEVAFAWPGNDGDQIELLLTTPPDSKLPLTDFQALLKATELTSYLPAGFPSIDLQLTNLCITASRAQRSLTSMSVELTLADPNAKLVVLDGLLTANALALQFSWQPAGLVASLSAGIEIQNTVMTGGLSFAGEIPSGQFAIAVTPLTTIDFASLLQTYFGNALSFVGSTTVQQLEVTGALAPPQASLQCQLTSKTWPVVCGLTLTQIGFGFEYTPGGGGTSLSVSAIAQWSDKIQFFVEGIFSSEGMTLTGELAPVAGATLADFLPSGVPLPDDLANIAIPQAVATVDMASGAFSLALTGDVKFDFGTAGGIDCTRIAITYQPSEKGSRWSLTAAGGLWLISKDFLDLEGTLTVAGDTSSNNSDFQMTYAPTATPKHVPLLIPASVSPFELSELTFTLQTLALHHAAQTGWSFSSQFRLTLTRAWAPLLRIVPSDGIDVTLSIQTNPGSATIELAGPALSLPVGNITFPGLPGSSSLDIGPSLFTISNLGLTLTAELNFSAQTTLTWYLPENTNDIFKQSDGSYFMQPFYTYDPSAATQQGLSVKVFAGYVNDDPQVGATLLEVPLKALSDASDPAYWALEIGPVDDQGNGKYGSIWIEKGKLDFDTNQGGFSIVTGWKIIRDPQIPLGFVRNLLKQSSLPHLADLVPDTLPVPLTDPPQFITNGKLDIDGLRAFFEKHSFDVPQQLYDLLSLVAELVDRLPVDLTSYLNFAIPQTFHFQLTVGATGNVNFAVSAQGTTPDDGVRLILPAVGEPFLYGINLRKVAFGELFGGTLFQLVIDADIDLFDAPSLVYSVLVGDALNKVLGDPTRFRRRIALHNLYTLIIWETEIPIPLPIFFDLVGIDYYGIGDFAFEAGIKNPAPGLALGEMVSWLSDLVRFISDPTFRLPTDKSYSPFTLQPALAPTFLTAPNWLGQRQLGLVNGVTPPSLMQCIAYGLDAVKFFDLDAAIAATPIDDRAGNMTGAISGFFSMSVDGAWLLATPYELVVEKAYQRLNLSPDEANALLAMLPPADDGPITAQTKGIAVFVCGTWQSTLGSLTAWFGLVAVGTIEFGTGFRIAGTIGNFYNFDGAALALLDVEQKTFSVTAHGTTSVTIAGQTLLQGGLSASASDSQLTVGGTLSLDSLGSTLSLTSANAAFSGVLSSNDFSLSGNANGTLLILSGSGNGSIATGNDPHTHLDVSVAGGAGFSFDVRPGATGLTVTGALDLVVFSLSVSAAVDVATRAIAYTLESQTFAGILGLGLSLGATFDSPGASGSFSLQAAGSRIVSGTATIAPPSISLSGDVSLLGIISGSVSGQVGPGNFGLSGNIHVDIVDCGGTITIGTNGVTFEIDLPVGDFSGSLTGGGHGLTICGSYYKTICGKRIGVSAYIDSSGVHLGGCPNDLVALPSVTARPKCAATLALDLQERMLHAMLRPVPSTLPADDFTQIGAPVDDRDVVIVVAGKRNGTLAMRITATRCGTVDDFFTELRNRVAQTCGQTRADAALVLDKASFEIEMANCRDLTKSVVRLRFPGSPEVGLHEIALYGDQLHPERLYDELVARVEAALGTR